jgi:hypothetical protein
VSLIESIRGWVSGKPPEQDAAAEATQDRLQMEEATGEGMPESPDQVPDEEGAPATGDQA